MNLRRVAWIAVVGLGIFAFLRVKSPSIPAASSKVLISLHEPYDGEVIVVKTITDPKAISLLADSFSQAKSGRDHKCGSIGTIDFVSSAGTTPLQVLPGHDPEKYEFRLDGTLYCLDREVYIDSLVAAGIERDDIRLDGHPEMKSSESR